MTSLYVNPWINAEFFFPSQGVLYPYPEGIKVYIKPFPGWSNRLILVLARVQRSGYWPPGSSRIAFSRFGTWANGSPFAVPRISVTSGAAELDLLFNSRTTRRSTVNFSQSYPQYPWHRMQLNSMLAWFSNLPGAREKVAV
jgi:hypothetical protein